MTPAGRRIKVDEKTGTAAAAPSEGDIAMSYDRIGVIGAMDSELAALVKKPDKSDKSVFQSFLMAMIQLRAWAYPLALPRCTLVFPKQLGFLNRL